MKVTAAMAVMALGAMTGQAAAQSVKSITGAGATFPYPVYSQWAHQYNQTTGVQLNYQAIGSGGGIAQIKAGTVDFGASDAPLASEELKDAGLIQFPMVMGGVVPVVNIAGINANELRLSPQTLAGIFMGQIKNWDDPAIKKDNPNINLPSKAVSVVRRSDGSGTTWIFTNYLSKVSAEWKSRLGNGTAIDWPVGVGGKGNAGVAAYVQRVDGSIGYVEYAYALQNKMASVMLQNKDGNYVAPNSETFQASAANADWAHADNFYLVLTDQPGEKSWPISGATFILMHKQQTKADTARAVLKFFDWAYENGDQAALKLDYIPMPDNVVELVHEQWKEQLKGSDGQTIWSDNGN